MAENNPLDPVQSSFFYANAPANSPLSYQSLLTRRKIAEALLSKRTALPFPKNLGEGLTYASDRLASAFGDREELARLDAAERASDAAYQKAATTMPLPGTVTPDRRSDAGDAATERTASGVPDVPYVPSGEGSVPLPPPRPAMDYSKMAAEVDANPALVGQMAAMGQGELPPNASLQQRQIQAQTALNRAQANNLPLNTALNNGYYPPQTFQRGTGDVGAYKRDVLDPLLRGADPSREALGFPASQNASNAPGNPVAANGIASGRYRPYAWMGGEMYGQKAGEGAALERFRNPFGPPARGDVAAAAPPDATAQGRDAITEAALAGAQPPVSNARVASLGGAGPLGNAGAASAVIPPNLPPTGPAAPMPPQGNPPIVVPNIAPRPTQTAQGAIPGPLTPPTPTPPPPPAPGSVQPLQIPTERPIPPVLSTTPTQDEIRGMLLMRRFPDDPRYQELAKQYMAAGAQQRQAEHAQKQETYKALNTLYEKGQEQALAAGSPKAALELQQAREAAARQQRDIEHFAGLTVEQALAPVKESYAEAKKLPAAATEIASAKRVLLSDPKMFTGAAADIQVSMAKLAAAAGLPLDPRVAPTEAFKSYVQGVVGALRPQVIGTGSQSNAELATLEKAAGAKSTLERGSIEQILNSIEKLNTIAAIEHQKKVLTVTGDDPNRQRMIFGQYGVPMQHIIPADVVNIFKRQYEKDPQAAIAAFDRKFHTPGLGMDISQAWR